MRVQQMMRFLAQRRSQELLVNLGDRRIDMGLAHRPPLILLVDRLDPRPAHAVGGHPRLSTAADAAAGAAHDFDEVVVGLARDNQIAHLAGVGKPMSHGDLGRHAIEKGPIRQAVLKSQRSLLFLQSDD